jgi:putative acetyltransferase
VTTTPREPTPRIERRSPQTASADYKPEQIAAWVGGDEPDLSQWDARRLAARTFVAVAGERTAGFADLLDDGLVDMLFVHPDFGRQGIARLLVDAVKREALRGGLSTLRVYASRTARPALEHFGFWVVAFRPHNLVGGQIVPNYEMQCDLATGVR